jgi:methylase of polypeptide subunit release factors
MTEPTLIHWNEAGAEQSAYWLSACGSPPPKRTIIADDTIKADDAYRLACEGTALLWRSDYHNAKQLLQAIARRIDAKAQIRKDQARKDQARKDQARKDQTRKSKATTLTEAFHHNRQSQAQRASILSMLLIPLNADLTIPLRRAPDVQQACSEVFGEIKHPGVMSLRELQGIIGAHEWRKKGVEIPALNARIHPHYGVFSPIRGEYLQLVNEAPLPAALKQHNTAFDIGTGTGVLAAILARRGIQHIIATDMHSSALNCARENIARLGFNKQIEIVQADLYPPGKAALIVCNPPWVPAKPSSALDAAIFDPDSRMLRGFLNGLKDHLEQDGEGWLILSDLAEHLGLRSRETLLQMIDAAGLKVLGKIDTLPHHPRASDHEDPLHAARAAETTSLWRLAIK